jgi:site-specific DNA recombinase
MTKTKAFGYIRVSTAKQVKDGTYEHQEKAIKKYCQYKDIHLIKLYEDLGQSGKKKNRKQLQAMNTFIENFPNNVDIIIITKLDRIGRSNKQLSDLIEFYQKYEMGVIAIDQNLDLTTTNIYQKLLVGMFKLFAEFEGDLIFERTWESRLEAEKKGVLTHRPLKKLLMTDKDILYDFTCGVSINALARKNKVTWITMNKRLKLLGAKL